MITKTVNCSVCVANNDSKFFFGNDNKKRLTSVSIQLVWDNLAKRLFLDMYPLNVVDFGDRRIAADIEFPSPYEFTIQIAKGNRNAKKESELLLKYLEENSEALIKAYNDNNQQGIVDVICGYKHKMRGLKQTTRTVVEDLHTALFLTQD